MLFATAAVFSLEFNVVNLAKSSTKKLSDKEKKYLDAKANNFHVKLQKKDYYYENGKNTSHILSPVILLFRFNFHY